MKTVYISLPMSGKEDTIWERYQTSIKQVKSIDGYEDCIIISPVCIDEFNPDNENFDKNYKGSHTWGWYMGKNMENLTDKQCTDIYMSEDWILSKGCRIEHETAKILGINRIYYHRFI